MMTKAQATAIAKKVADQLGAPWTPYVWENLGWHASCEFEGGYLHKGGDGMTLYIDEEHRRYSVMGINTTLGDGRSPIAAVRRAHAELNRRVAEANHFAIPLYSAIARATKAKR